MQVLKPEWAKKRIDEQQPRNVNVYVMFQMKVLTIWEHLELYAPEWKDQPTRDEGVEVALAAFDENVDIFVQPCLIGAPAKKDRPIFHQDGLKTFHPFKITTSYADFVKRCIVDDGFIEKHNIFITARPEENVVAEASVEEVEQVVAKFKKG